MRRIVSLILVSVVWASLGITIWMQQYEINSLRYSLAIVSGSERGMFRSVMAEHKSFRDCMILQLSSKPVLQSSP